MSDWEISLVLSALMDDKSSMRNRLIAEASYRLMRSSNAAMTEEQESLIDELTTFRFREREGNRSGRRIIASRVKKLRGEAAQEIVRTSPGKLVCIK
jgi:hypothetical protein